jgi:Cu(I)/Ag(I) efflux system membrane fusion protein
MTTENQHVEPSPSPARPRRRLAGFALVALAGIALGSVGTTLLARGGGDGHDHGAGAPAKQMYQCPMHPSVVQDHPGECPICGMKLVPMAAEAAGAKGATGKAAEAPKPKYLCPMHPTVTSDHPDNCPLCGMKLVPAPASEGGGEAAAGGESAAGRAGYQCPMHSAVQSDKPDNCRVCGMKLEKLSESGGFDVPKGERKIVFYRSPMDPKQTSHTPRKDEMGMDYVPVYLDELQGEGPVQGLVTVKIDPARQQLIGLVTAPATTGTFSATLRTTGRVAVDETRVHRVNVKFGGFVEKVFADFVGQPIQRGQPLFSIYSPELLAAQEELALALRTQKALSAAQGLAGDGDDLVAAARRKLELWDVPAAGIERLMQGGQPERAVTVVSPAAGVIVKKEVVPGQRLEAGAMPYEVWDLSSIWALADVYETELQHVKVGAPATLTLKAFPGKEYQGRVAFIDPVLDPKTRTAKVRLAFANPGGALKPEMFGEVVLGTPPRKALRIPADAVIDSGTRSVVFVAMGDGKFQPRVVRLGASDGTDAEVLDGLTEGEQIVTRANFLVDSESRLKASLQALGGGK